MSSEDTGSGPQGERLPAGLATLLDDEAMWLTPPADGLDRLLDVIAADRAAAGRTPEAPVESLPRRSRWRTAVALAAAAVAVFAAGLLVGNAGDDSGEAASATDDELLVAQFPALGTSAAPDAEAEVEVFDRGAGYALILDMRGLAPADDGSFYEGWLRSPAGDEVSVGTFHMRGGDDTVVLWSGVALADYPTLVVTRHDAGSSAADEEVMVGQASGLEPSAES